MSRIRRLLGARFKSGVRPPIPGEDRAEPKARHADDLLPEDSGVPVQFVADGPLLEPAAPRGKHLPPSPQHYRVLTRLGGGGMGDVYKAEDTRLRRFVALKFLSADIAKDKQAVERFLNEARAASALNHQNICTVYDIGECDGDVFIAMEFLEGESLRDALSRRALSPAQVMKLAIQCANGLEAAHSKGIIHRDIKPENLFVVTADRIKILDFGIAKLQSTKRFRGQGQGQSEATTRTAQSSLTQPGVAIGTLAYMSPEQTRAEEVDRRTDLFSLGTVLFEMVSGRQAFPGRTPADVSAAVLTHHPVITPSGGPPFLVGMQAIVDKALEKQADFRYQDAADLATDLRRLERDCSLNGFLSRGLSTPRGWVQQAHIGGKLLGDLIRGVALTALLFAAHDFLSERSAGKYLNQFALAFVQENLQHGPLDDTDFEAGGRYLPVVVDISALHPDKRRVTDRQLLDVLVNELRRHGASAVGIDLSFDDLQPTDFEYLHKWVAEKNVRVGVYRKAVERREAWLGRPEFSALAAGIAVPADNPQHAFAYSRRWFVTDPNSVVPKTSQDCSARDVGPICKEDLIQLPVALWLMSEHGGGSFEETMRSGGLESRLRRILDESDPRPFNHPPEDSVEFGTYVIDYAYLKELRREVVRISPRNEANRAGDIVAQLEAQSARFADRVVLVGDLEDTSDQLCYTQGMKPLPGILIHACSLATLNRGMLFEPHDFNRTAKWALCGIVCLMILGLRVIHTNSRILRGWSYQHLEIVVFVLMSVAVIVACRWLAWSSGIVWPNFLWVAAALALFPLSEPFYRIAVATPQMLRAYLAAPDKQLQGN